MSKVNPIPRPDKSGIPRDPEGNPVHECDYWVGDRQYETYEVSPGVLAHSEVPFIGEESAEARSKAGRDRRARQEGR